MTSSVTSTEKALVTRGSGPPAVGPGAEPPTTRPPGLTPERMRSIALAAFVWLPALGILAFMYGTKLTVGAVFLALGWVSLALAAWHIGRAVLAFDVTPGETLGLEAQLDEERRNELKSEKKHLLKAIKEIEFDHQMGKLDDRDAAEITMTYRARALEIMRLLDENKGVDYDLVVEKEVAKRIAKTGGLAKKSLPAKVDPKADVDDEDDDVPAEAATDVPTLKPEVDTGTPKVAGKCAACGTRNDEDAVFCKKCAARLTP